jgi:hypothetical protein
MRYLCNVFTIAMAPQGGILDFQPITTDVARTLILYPPMGLLTHAVGHEQTAKLANSQLHPKNEDIVKFSRISVQLEAGDDLILCQYIGPRLPEGVTTLPEGSEIRWYYAVYTRHTPELPKHP